jgi:hypothetical protein
MAVVSSEWISTLLINLPEPSCWGIIIKPGGIGILEGTING